MCSLYHQTTALCGLSEQLREAGVFISLLNVTILIFKALVLSRLGKVPQSVQEIPNELGPNEEEIQKMTRLILLAELQQRAGAENV